MQQRFGWVLPAVAVAAGSAASFLMVTIVMDQMPDAVVIGAPLALVGLFALAASGIRVHVAVWQEDRPSVLHAAVGGLLAFWAAPLIALTQRASDAPSGSETLFFTTAAWALIVVVIAHIDPIVRSRSASAAAALAATTGAAALLANWERPSSFSPFVRFPTQEMIMLAAGVVFAAGVVLIARSLKNRAASSVIPIALMSAGLAGILGAIVDPPSLAALMASAWPLAILAAATAGFVWGWISLTKRTSVLSAASALFLAPVAVTALAAVERATSVRGPNPIVWPGAIAGIIAIASGAGVLALGAVSEASGTGGAPRRSTRTHTISVVVGWSALASAAIALALPALSALSVGVVAGEPFEAHWLMIGAETAVGWLAVSAAALALSATSRRSHSRTSWSAAIAALLVAGAGYTLRATPFYTITRWIPAEVQQTYGTEYARMTVAPVVEPVRILAFVLSLVTVLLVFVTLVQEQRRRGDAEVEVTQ